MQNYVNSVNQRYQTCVIYPEVFGVYECIIFKYLLYSDTSYYYYCNFLRVFIVCVYKMMYQSDMCVVFSLCDKSTYFSPS